MKVVSAVKTTVVAVLLLAVLGGVVIGWTFFTAKGSDTALGALQNRLKNLSYTYNSGNLASGIVLKDLQWNLANKTQIRAADVVFQWNPACWRGKELCLKSATAREVTIVIAPAKEKKNPIVLPTLKIPVSLKTDSLMIEKLVIENSTQSPIVLSNIEFAGALEQSTLIADSLQFDWKWIHAETQGEMRLVDNYPIKIDGKINSIGDTLALPVNADINLGGDLLETLLQADVAAPYPAEVAGQISILTRKLPANLNISWEESEWPRGSSDPLAFANNGQFILSGKWPDYGLTGTTEISGPSIPAATAIMNGTVNTKRATYKPLQIKTLDGVIDATGTLKWRNGLAWQADLSTDSLLPGTHWEQLRGNINGSAVFNGRINNGQTQLNFSEINTRGRLHGHPFSIIGSVSKSAEGTYQFTGLEASSARNTLNINGNINYRANKSATDDIVNDDSNLSLIFSLKSPQDFFPDLRGNIHGSLGISGDISKPDINGTASSASLTYKDTSFTNTKLDGVLRSLGEEESEIQVHAQNIAIKDQTFNAVEANLNGSLADHLLRLKFSSPALSVQKLQAIGHLDEYKNWTGIVDTVKGSIGSHPAWLDKPFSIAFINEKNSLALQAHCWTINLASACVRKSALIGKTGVVNFSLNGLNLETLETQYPPNFSAKGFLQSSGVLTWGAGNKPSFDMEAVVQEATVTVKDDEKEILIDISNASVNTSTDRGIVNTQLNINTDKLGKLGANLIVDTSKKNYPLEGVVSVSESELKWLAPYIPQLTKLAGRLTAEAKLSGFLSSPEFDGQIQINEASVAAPQLPLDLDDITLDLTFDRKTVALMGHAQSDGKDIQLTGDGRLSDQSWEADLNIKAEKIPLTHEFFENTVVSPDLNIQMNPTGISVGGKLHVPRAEIKINQIGDAGIPLSKDVTIVDAEEKKQKKSYSQQKISTSVDIILGRDVHFSGFGLSADLRGDFTVKMTPQRTPELLGEIMVDNGTYRSYGQNLIIRDGRINFVGPLEQAALSVEAFREVGSVIAGLRVDGSLQNPTTTLFSEPQLPQEEILSYVVLGRQLQFGDDDRDDSKLLANAALFMGISNGRNLSNNIAKNLGIEDFALTANGTGDNTQVMLSGRLNNRLLVRYGVGVFNSVNTLFLRYDLADQLYLETTQGLEKAVDLFYSFEFD